MGQGLSRWWTPSPRPPGPSAVADAGATRTRVHGVRLVATASAQLRVVALWERANEGVGPSDPTRLGDRRLEAIAQVTWPGQQRGRLQVHPDREERLDDPVVELASDPLCGYEPGH